eukprot:scaffold159783_cov18-Tisochrysis_lutea.AAC.1
MSERPCVQVHRTLACVHKGGARAACVQVHRTLACVHKGGARAACNVLPYKACLREVARSVVQMVASCMQLLPALVKHAFGGMLVMDACHVPCCTLIRVPWHLRLRAIHEVKTHR